MDDYCDACGCNWPMVLDGQNDFGLWQVKVHAMLVPQGLVEALDGEAGFPKEITQKDKEEILKKTHKALILSLGDKPLREVSKEKMAK